jgi:hypothetical protein
MRLGITPMALGRYIARKKIPAPKMVEVGARRVYMWTEHDIERARELLPKIKNGRKTRYKKEEKSEKPPKRQKKS